MIVQIQLYKKVLLKSWNCHRIADSFVTWCTKVWIWLVRKMNLKLKKNRSKSLILWKRQKCLKVAKLPVMYKNYQEIKKLGSGIFIFDQFAILTNLMPQSVCFSPFGFWLHCFFPDNPDHRFQFFQFLQITWCYVALFLLSFLY